MLRLQRPAVNVTTTAITTTAAVKDYLGEASAEDDTRIGNIVKRVNWMLYARLREKLLTAQTYDYLLDGPRNQVRLWLPELPVISIALLENGYMGSSGWETSQAFTAAHYTLDAESGIIELRPSNYFAVGRQAVRCTWNAGYNTLPEDIVHAATIWAVNVYVEIAGRRTDITSEGHDTGSTEFLFSNIPEDAALTIERYRRRTRVI